MNEITEFMSEARLRVDASLDLIIPSAKSDPMQLHNAIRWSVFAGGKRVRPAIVYAVGRAFDCPAVRLEGTAAAVEMMHTYSLIHDDLPAMDDDDLRRGRATCHRQFDEATAILAGDALQTFAFAAIADDQTLTAEVRVMLISMLAKAAGTPDGMIAGQQQDLDAEGRSITNAELARIHNKKTGALIEFAAGAGAVIGGADPDEFAALIQFGKNFGLMYQITDDLLDVTQSTEVLGKTAGKDAAARKATYLSAYGQDGARERIGMIASETVSALDLPGRDTFLLRKMTEMVASRTS